VGGARGKGEAQRTKNQMKPNRPSRREAAREALNGGRPYVLEAQDMAKTRERGDAGGLKGKGWPAAVTHSECKTMVQKRGRKAVEKIRVVWLRKELKEIEIVKERGEGLPPDGPGESPLLVDEKKAGLGSIDALNRGSRGGGSGDQRRGRRHETSMVQESKLCYASGKKKRGKRGGRMTTTSHEGKPNGGAEPLSYMQTMEEMQTNGLAGKQTRRAENDNHG